MKKTAKMIKIKIEFEEKKSGAKRLKTWFEKQSEKKTQFKFRPNFQYIM